MQITFILVGKTTEPFIINGFDMYCNRISNYIQNSCIVIPDVKKSKSTDVNLIKQKEANEILKKIPPQSYVVLLSERGKGYTSIEFSKFIAHKMQISVKNLVFIVGGAYGVDKTVEDRADAIISFSKMTYTHQFIRLMLSEQIYRAFTIINNEPYHNE
ncbi:MAG: 23S rRNA (pseudouridine(1915)-N(3))-methyltransferase RlmH [Lentimicrobiaceae bacterium]|nr:23S rRNA (pseudouridine(1915)-N(3))-methyltransferase RlmH [Lentimicrobiaceae bacterium]